MEERGEHLGQSRLYIYGSGLGIRLMLPVGQPLLVLRHKFLDLL